MDIIRSGDDFENLDLYINQGELPIEEEEPLPLQQAPRQRQVERINEVAQNQIVREQAQEIDLDEFQEDQVNLSNLFPSFNSNAGSSLNFFNE